MAKQRMIRPEPEPAGNTEVLRAHVLDERLLRENAETNFGLYGYYGLSVFYPAGEWTRDRILTEKLKDAAQLTVLRVDDLVIEGLRVLPTGAEPHGDIVEALVTGRAGDHPGHLDPLVAAVMGARHHVEDNPFHRPGEEMP